MAPKKGGKTLLRSKAASPAAAAAAAQPHAQPPEEVNPLANRYINFSNGYIDALKADEEVIVQKWPTIKSLDPLPPVGDSGFMGLKGFGATFDAASYDEQKESSLHGIFLYSCHTNILSNQHDITQSQLPYVPLYRERVLEYADSMLDEPTSILQQSPLVLHGSLPSGNSYKDAPSERLSPCEPVHALVYRVATRIKENAPESELVQWLRVILSFPTVFKGLKVVRDGTIDDAKYAEANSLRQDASTLARAVVLTVRQLVRNIIGFKEMKEKALKASFSAASISAFFQAQVRTSADMQHLTKKSVIDTCITIGTRMFSVDGLEQIIDADERRHGATSFWNSIYRCQEFVSRFQKPVKMLWAA
jgi:hypothetical protein